MSAPVLLASEGILEGRVLAAHAVWLDDVDLAVLEEHDVAVAHCPGSNGKLGSGIAPARDARSGHPGGSVPTARPPMTTSIFGTNCAWLRSCPASRATRSRELGRGAPTGHPGGGEALGLPVGALEVGRRPT